MHCVHEFVIAFRSYSWSMSKPGTIYSPAGDDGRDVCQRSLHQKTIHIIYTHIVQFLLFSNALGHPNKDEERNFSNSLKTSSVHMMICIFQLD